MWGRGGVLIERRAPRQAARAGNAAAFSLSPLSYWISLCLWHLSGVGPAPSMHSSCVCLSTRRPLPLVGIDTGREGKRGEGGGTRGSHTKQKLPLLKRRHPILCKFLHPIHTHAHTAPFLQLFVSFLSLHLI